MNLFKLRANSLRSLVSLFAVLGLCAACNDSDDETERYSVRIAGDSTLFNDAKARVLLLGIDANIQDAAATVVDDNILAVTELPALLEFDWPRDAHTLIREPAVSDPANARYSLVVTVDVGNDGMVCQGDLVQDFDLTPFEVFSVRPGSTITIAMKEQEIDFCRPFSMSIPVEL